MDGLAHALLFSRPANGWRLENSNRELTSAWLAPQSPALVNETGGDTLSAAFISAGFVTPSLRTGLVPTEPDGGPTITGIWISNASGNWGTATNWQSGTVPQGSNARARFDTLDITTNVTVTNEVARTIGDIIVGDTNGTNAYNITGATITFENVFDSSSDLSQIATSAGDTISAPLLLANDLSVFNFSTNVLTLSGAISSNAPANESTGITFWQGNVNVTSNISDAINRPVFIEVRAGVVTLSGTNSYTRPTSIDGGTLLVNGDNSASTGTVFVRGEGSVLGGTGTIGGDVVMFQQSTITGGTTTTVGTLTLQQDVLMVTGDGTGGTYLANLSGATSDLLAITGQFLLGQGSTLNIQGTADGLSTYILATFASHSDTFQFVSGIPDNYFLVYNATDLELVPIPEPATWIGGGLAVAAIGWMSRRRLRRHARAA
jgi:autotransporter-associated beta strand protein